MAIAEPARNLELKVRADSTTLAVARARLAADGVASTATTQVDTYFAVPHGRLKLRETVSADDPAAAELIAYARPDAAGPRWSAYRRVPVAANEAVGLKAALAETVGVRVVVRKRREVSVRRRTRVHLDEVDGLGAFLELETVAAGEDDEAAAELAETAARLGLDPAGPLVIAGSYADLVLAARAAETTRRRDEDRAGGKRAR